MARPVAGRNPRIAGLWPPLAGDPDPAAAAASIAAGAPYWLCGSGRRALHEALLREPPAAGRRLWIPAFMCRGVVPVIVAAGFEPQLYDLDEQLRPCVDVERVREGDGVLAAYFFGLVHDLQPLYAALRARGAVLIEDCAHLLMPGYQGAPAGRTGDWSIFSFRKQLPVASGAMLLGRRMAAGESVVVSNRPALREALLVVERIAPAVLGARYCSFVEWTRERLDGVRSGARWTADEGRAIGAATLRALPGFDLQAIAERRRQNFTRLASALTGAVPGAVLPGALAAGSVPLAFPVLVDTPTSAAATILRAGVGAFFWPGFEVLPDVEWAGFAGTRRWLDHLLCLPIHQDLGAEEIDRIAEIVAKAVRQRAAI